MRSGPALGRWPARRPWRGALARLAGVGLLGCTLAVAGSACAQERPARSALIVGVSTYADADVPVLAGVPFDIASARAVARAMGIAEAQTTVLRDGQATKAAILDALEQLARNVTEGSRVFVYFSGHGTRWFEPALQGCKEGLLAHDRQTITNEEIAQSTRRMGALADKVVVMFDACHSDGVSGKASRMRDVASGALTPKFFLKSGADTQRCAKVSNVLTRALVTEATRLGGLRENFVQITSSRADEVSFDEPGQGGIATQSVRDCLLGQAEDRDASGAVSVGEVEQCAQALIDRKLRPFAELRPHHVTVSGNRNIVPVPVPAPAPVPIAVPAPVPAPLAAASAPVPLRPASASVLPTTPPSAPVTSTAVPPAPAAPSTPAAAAPPAPAPAATPALASLATLRDIEAQRNPRRQVTVTLKRSTLKIGQDLLALTVRASHDGYLYVVLLGSDRKSFYLLFPNALDRDNALRAGTPYALPRPGWDLLAQGPAGTDHLLVLVSDTPRDLAALGGASADPAAPYTYTLNDLHGRRALIDFFTGRGVTGSSGNYGTRLLSVREVE